MRANYSVVSLIAALFLNAKAVAQEPQETQWIIPDVTYSCTARISQDWSDKKKASYFEVSTEAFDVKARITGTVAAKKEDFKIVRPDSDLKSIKDTDLGDFVVELHLNLKGDDSVSLEGMFTLKPKHIKKAVHLVANSPPTAEKIPETLSTEVRIMFGSDKDIAKSGPISFSATCQLKKQN